MTTTMVLGLLVAILVFWAVGAYNRLVRLRSDAVSAFSALDNVVSVQSALIRAAQPAASSLEPDRPSPFQDSLWPRLEAAGEQVAQALSNARARPLDPEAIRALSTAYGVMTDAWRSPQAQRLDGTLHPQDLRARLAALDEQAVVHAANFDASVAVYNVAIRQFPALVLAGIWHFRPAQTLEWSRAAE